MLALVLNLCVDQETPETNYTIINNTSQDVKIEPFSRDRNEGALTGSFIRGDILEISKKIAVKCKLQSLCFSAIFIANLKSKSISILVLFIYEPLATTYRTPQKFGNNTNSWYI